jgi:hypothetical protein
MIVPLDSDKPGAVRSRGSKELTTADSSRDVVTTAARPDTMCLVRGDIPLVMFVLLCW